jgi:hypothetical protein
MGEVLSGGGIVGRVFGFQFSIFSFRFSVFSFWFSVFGFWFSVFGFWFSVFGFWFSVFLVRGGAVCEVVCMIAACHPADLGNRMVVAIKILGAILDTTQSKPPRCRPACTRRHTGRRSTAPRACG